MSKSDKQVNLPVQRDQRTYEQQHRDMLSSMERDYGRRQPGHDIVPHGHYDWDTGLSDWIEDSWSQMHREMDRVRRNMMWLEPMDNMPSMRRPLWPAIPEFMTHMPDFGATFDDLMKNTYEVGEDGKPHFKVRIDAQGFRPEDIHVKAEGRELIVDAKTNVQTEHGSSTRQFQRKFILPASIEANQLQCKLTNDDILVLDAPVTQADAHKLTFDKNRQLGIKPAPPAGSSGRSLVKTGQPGLVVQGVGHERHVHIEVHVGPGWSPDQLSVHVRGRSLVVSGKRPGGHDTAQELSTSYTLPAAVDLMQVKSQLIDDVLVVEAPLT